MQNPALELPPSRHNRYRRATATKHASTNLSPLSLATDSRAFPRCELSHTSVQSLPRTGPLPEAVPHPPQDAKPLQHKSLPALGFHTNILLLKILKAPCDFVKGSILATDFKEASNLLEKVQKAASNRGDGDGEPTSLASIVPTYLKIRS